MQKSELEKYKALIYSYARKNYQLMFREPAGILKHKFIVPGGGYQHELWDWDSWLTDLALGKIAEEDIFEYEKGCILNFLEHTQPDGRMPIVIFEKRTGYDFLKDEDTNTHKPVLAQHALFVCVRNNNFEWMRDSFGKLECYIDFYFKQCRNDETGLFFWIDDFAIGVDNDPCTFYRPKRSSGSILLNCFMYKELLACAGVAKHLGLQDRFEKYTALAEELKNAVQEHCWDERDGFYYNVDLNLLPIDKNAVLHSGCPRNWSCLIQRIEVWSGFLAMWSGIATKEQARRMVEEHYRNENSFLAPYGVRTLSKQEKMYQIVKSGNPSCWLGPVWGISNYMVFKGLVDYGYHTEAKALCEKTVRLFGRDLEENGTMHEYYDPDTGKGITHPGFQNWNLLVVDMMSVSEKLEGETQSRGIAELAGRHSDGIVKIALL